MVGFCKVLWSFLHGMSGSPRIRLHEYGNYTIWRGFFYQRCKFFVILRSNSAYLEKIRRKSTRPASDLTKVEPKLDFSGASRAHYLLATFLSSILHPCPYPSSSSSVSMQPALPVKGCWLWLSRFRRCFPLRPARSRW